jgi:hypothetical protein
MFQICIFTHFVILLIFKDGLDFFVIESLEVDREISSTLENQIFTIQVISFIFSAM